MMTRKRRQTKASKKSPIQPHPSIDEVHDVCDDQASLPEEVTVEENVEDNSDLSVLEKDQSALVSVVSAFEDEVTINPEEDIPKYLRFDLHSNKYIFQLSKFDFDPIIDKHKFNVKGFVLKMNSDLFLRESSAMMKSFYQPLTLYYQSGFSSKFKHNFCAVLASKLPFCEKKFHLIKQKSAKGKLSNDLSKTVKALVSYSDFLYYRFDINSRHNIKQSAKKRNLQLKVNKPIGSFVAARNRMRKSLASESAIGSEDTP